MEWECKLIHYGKENGYSSKVMWSQYHVSRYISPIKEFEISEINLPSIFMDTEFKVVKI